MHDQLYIRMDSDLQKKLPIRKKLKCSYGKRSLFFLFNHFSLRKRDTHIDFLHFHPFLHSIYEAFLEPNLQFMLSRSETHFSHLLCLVVLVMDLLPQILLLHIPVALPEETHIYLCMSQSILLKHIYVS